MKEHYEYIISEEKRDVLYAIFLVILWLIITITTIILSCTSYIKNTIEENIVDIAIILITCLILIYFIHILVKCIKSLLYWKTEYKEYMRENGEVIE